jgi:hypothetical protein|tara:strand:- start:321 stop:515 length:195 start_codon:yes stop_codon:yes gene_type:complete
MDDTKSYTARGVVIVVDSTHKEAVLSVVNSYFGKNATEKDLNEDGSYTMRLYVKEDKSQEESNN